MMIREFHSKFSSADESSFLFVALRRLSLIEEITSLAFESWSGWPPGDPGTGTPVGPPSLQGVNC